MSQQLSVATRSKKNNFGYLFVSPEEIDRSIGNILDLVARRAYEIYESRGGEHGSDLEDWFQAESEVLQPVTVAFENPADAYVAVADVSRYQPDNLKIAVEPQRLKICGMSNVEEGQTDGRQDGAGQSGHFYFFFNLPTEINPATASADIRHDILEVRLPKVLSHVDA